MYNYSTTQSTTVSTAESVTDHAQTKALSTESIITSTIESISASADPNSSSGITTHENTTESITTKTEQAKLEKTLSSWKPHSCNMSAQTYCMYEVETQQHRKEVPRLDPSKPLIELIQRQSEEGKIMYSVQFSAQHLFISPLSSLILQLFQNLMQHTRSNLIHICYVDIFF